MTGQPQQWHPTIITQGQTSVFFCGPEGGCSGMSMCSFWSFRPHFFPGITALDQWSRSHLHGRVCAALNPNSSSKEGPWKGLMSQSQMWHKQDFCSPLPTHSSKNDQEMPVVMCPTPYLVPQEETKTHLLLYPPPYKDVTLGKLA